MFFSTELLSKRDSGYGLLWLAATLGSKSKKLPRRSVLTADIQQLCGLISEPPEPLALRLSSNLMVGVVRVYKLKHEIFHNDVSNCFASLKKTLQELHSAGGSSLDMAQPNGLREDALNIVVEPGMAMLAEFDANDMDWDFVFRKAGEVMVDEEFAPDVPAKSSSFAPIKRNLHKLDESHDHLFSSSFLNSLSGEADAGGNNGPSSSANDVMFDLDFGADAEVGLGEEMERELEEAGFFSKPKGDEGDAIGLVKASDFETVPMDLDAGFGGGDAGGGMDFGDDAFGFPSGVEQAREFDYGGVIPQNDNQEIDSNWLTGTKPMHTPPPHDKVPSRSCLSRRSPEVEHAGDHVDGSAQTRNEGGKSDGAKKHRKKVTLLDPRTELTDDQLKFQRDNYLNEMKRLRREAKKKKELREGKRQFEEMLWAPPADFVAPELIEFYKQRVVYPVKAREAAWRREAEELQNPKKRRRLESDNPQELDEEPAYIVQDQGVQNIVDYEYPANVKMDFMGGIGEEAIIDVAEILGLLQEDAPSRSRRSSDSPGRPRRATSRPPSPRRSSQFGQGVLDPDNSQPVSNSLFPWDHAGPSSSSGALAPAGSLGAGGWGSEMGLSLDSAVVRIKRSSRSASASGSPLQIVRVESQQLEIGDAMMMDMEGPEMNFEASLGDANLIETQESESMVTLERNSFNFLGYAKMHTVSSSKPLFFSDLVPIDSSSARVAAEGFYHCLALATKDLIRLKQTQAFGPIEIQIK